MRIRMVHCKMRPMGIYGAEVTPMSDTALRTLRGAIFSTLRSRCDMGANAGLLFAELATRGWEVDPELRVAHNRIAALTRAWGRDPGLRENLDHVWRLLHEAGHPATSGEGSNHTKPIAPPGCAA